MESRTFQYRRGDILKGMLTEEEIRYFLAKALEEAELALEEEEVPVGCVFVQPDTKEVLCRGHNKTNETGCGTEHAEIVALKSALLENGWEASTFEDSILFVSCEPCIMCAAAIAKLKIRSVYFGCYNERFGGNGSILSVHNERTCNGGHSYDAFGGIMEEEAVNIFRRFYDTENRRAPDHKRRRKGEKASSDGKEGL